ncbi:MAG: hypothetical protein KDA80_22300 [Planctomycetaceae bacterium]|nr:hypothetical protein [Planctomycetaceae bacterium]
MSQICDNHTTPKTEDIPMQRSLFSSLFAFVLLAQATFAQDFSDVKSGMLLGIYAAPGQGGMRVTGIIPGYSAEGRLFPGDVLLRATLDGAILHRLRTNYEMENAKMAIGANREAAIEFWRPGQGLMYAWVEFTPIAAPAATFSFGGVAADTAAPPQSKAMFKLESEKPGARDLFQSGKPQTSLKPPVINGPTPVGPNPVFPGGKKDPGSLFGG